MADVVRITKGFLDERGKEIILRGLLDPTTIGNIKADDYQREIMSGDSFNGLVKAFQSGGKVPDITLGMRGSRCTDRDSVYTLRDDVFVIDGLQRIGAAKRAAIEKPDTTLHLGCIVYFDTTKEMEREQFRILNLERVRVSPNVLLRNMKEDYDVVDTIHSLSTADQTFVLHDRVCWTQKMRRSDLTYARILLRTIGHLHSHMGPGRSSRIMELVPGLQVIMDRTGKNIFRENTRTFFGIVDECWGVRNASYSGATQLRSTFLICLAQMFSDNQRFFFKDGKRLGVDADTRRKLKQFPVNDPEIARLASSSGGQGTGILYIRLIQHINKGRRKNRLRIPDEDTLPRDPDRETGEDDTDER